jgi:dephospho-CoA kinase
MPFILEHINQTIAAHSGENVIVDAPLLFESGLDRQCDKVLSVIADPQIALERIIRRDNLTTEEAKKRLASQHPAEYYTTKSDYILKNNGGIAALKEQTLELLQQLL